MGTLNDILIAWGICLAVIVFLFSQAARLDNDEDE